MILSRVMRERDYPELEEEGKILQQVHAAGAKWFPPQHKHRLWEYTLALKALRTVYPERVGLLASDVGCACCYLSPMLVWLGHWVKMYEIWQYGFFEGIDMKAFTLASVEAVKGNGHYELIDRGMGDLRFDDCGMDAAFSISTLEHIPEYQKAFRNLLQTVRPGGLVFLTTDFGEHEEDTYKCAGVRGGKMFARETYLELQKIGENEGFQLLDGEDWNWTEDCRLVHDYGFASLAMKRAA